MKLRRIFKSNLFLVIQIVDDDLEEFEILRETASIFPKNDLRRADAAVFFYSVQTICSRTQFNPSWINKGECASVQVFYKKLLEKGVPPNYVGIISPYQEQVRIIRSAIEADGLALPKVGSVEEFQGQERMIILISTVRSKRRKEDKEFGLGFVSHPKRINVAISRARSMLVVFGNALFIAEDPTWKAVLTGCQKEFCYFQEQPVARR